MLNDNYIEEQPIQVDSERCKNNPGSCCYEVNPNGAKGKIGFMCKKGTCNYSTGFCDIGSDSNQFNKFLGSLYTNQDVEGYQSMSGCTTYRNIFWILLVFVAVLVYFILDLNSKLKMYKRRY